MQKKVSLKLEMQEKIHLILRERVKKNLEEGKGFRLNNAIKGIEEVQILNLQVQMNYGGHLLMF